MTWHLQETDIWQLVDSALTATLLCHFMTHASTLAIWQCTVYWQLLYCVLTAAVLCNDSRFTVYWQLLYSVLTDSCYTVYWQVDPEIHSDEENREDDTETKEEHNNQFLNVVKGFFTKDSDNFSRSRMASRCSSKASSPNRACSNLNTKSVYIHLYTLWTQL